MRKVTSEVVSAWMAHKAKRVGNTRTDGQSIWLFDNEICRRNEDGSIMICCGGYPSRTTMDRLNGVLHLGRFGFAVAHRKGVGYLWLYDRQKREYTAREELGPSEWVTILSREEAVGRMIAGEPS